MLYELIATDLVVLWIATGRVYMTEISHLTRKQIKNYRDNKFNKIDRKSLVSIAWKLRS